MTSEGLCQSIELGGGGLCGERKRGEEGFQRVFGTRYDMFRFGGHIYSSKAIVP